MKAQTDIQEKIAVLSGAAKYDASCASSGSTGAGRGGAPAFGVSVPAGVCHSWTEDGRCVSLLKVLFSNVCRFDCAYCVNRASADIKRVSFTVTELVDLTCAFYKRNYIEGLFLSSGIFSDSDIVMEKLIAVARVLRTESGYGGYIHLKIIPGAGEKMIREAGLWADRLSANIELPTDRSLQTLAPEKSGKLIFGAMGNFSALSGQFEEDKKRIRSTPAFAPAGQSTQLIVGASAEDDRQIIGLSGSLYKKFSLRRVYYSAFIPVGAAGGVSDPRLPVMPEAALPEQGPPHFLLTREHRLYQADWLLRFYHFTASEILDDSPFLDPHIDPKTAWAIRHLDFFPVEINSADYEVLLRVPGIGAKTARRIIETRRSRSLSFDNLRRMGAVLKRARYFISAGGAFIDRPEDPRRIRRLISDEEDSLQLPLFEF
jgi:putative DNA modification/repair radical SAM protein